MSNFLALTCACCGASLTKPQFFNGKVYGYTCINKVAGTGHLKQTQKMTQVETAHIDHEIGSARISAFIVLYNSKRFNLGVCYPVLETDGTIHAIRQEQFIYYNGLSFVNDSLLNKMKQATSE